jgi:hypothetical protein
MSFLVSIMLALSAAEPTMPAQAVHYGRLAEGLVRSRFIRKGMTGAEVRVVLRQHPNCMVGGMSKNEIYDRLGLVVVFVPDDAWEMRVSTVGWYYRPFRR